MPRLTDVEQIWTVSATEGGIAKGFTVCGNHITVDVQSHDAQHRFKRAARAWTEYC